MHSINNMNNLVENLHFEAAYEFRVSTILLKDDSRSLPSDSSQIIRLPSIDGIIEPSYFFDLTTKLPPQRPQPPEYLDFEESDCLTLCWFPAQSVLPVLVSFFLTV